jgi:hypothetical protein
VFGFYGNLKDDFPTDSGTVIDEAVRRAEIARDNVEQL